MTRREQGFAGLLHAISRPSALIRRLQNLARILPG